MPEYKRYAIYWAPEPGEFADQTAAWLGWDAARGCAVAHPDLPGLPRPAVELTEAPRKYGFHGTLKAPFRLAADTTPEALGAACAALAATVAPVRLPGLRFAVTEGFLVLVPEGDETELGTLAAKVVRGLDPFRAPPSEDEIARRRPERLSERQRTYLAEWGYPYVMEEFRFHLTLTGSLPPDEGQATKAVLSDWLGPVLPRPFVVGDLCLFGEAADGMFRILHRYPLSA